MKLKLIILDEDTLDEYETELIKSLGKSREEILDIIEEDKRTHHIHLVPLGEEAKPW